MGSFFQVDLDVLNQFVTALSQSDDNMSDALHALADAGESTQIGTDDLNSAAGHFQSTWHYGMTQIHSMTKDTGDRVNQVYSAYRDVDNGIADALGKMGSGLDTGSAGGGQ